MRATAIKVFNFYRDGFAGMTVGKSLWKIILIKVLVMFAVLKLFFFPNYLKQNFETDEQRANHVLEQITRQVADNNQYRGGIKND